jgi:3-methyladenine DNA glycosylase AlkD
MNPADIASEIQRRARSGGVLNTPALRQLRREYTRRLAASDAKFMLDLALHLVVDAVPVFVDRFFAYELLTHHPAGLASLRARDVEALGRGLDSWAAVDTFACYVTGPAWREGQLSDALIRRWSRSPDRWWRRTALVSTVPLNCPARGGRGDTPRTLVVCESLLHDRDDMVVKAMSWALRELSKRDASAVEDFLSSHGSAVAPRVIREVRNKLRTGLKNPRTK